MLVSNSTHEVLKHMLEVEKPDVLIRGPIEQYMRTSLRYEIASKVIERLGYAYFYEIKHKGTNGIEDHWLHSKHALDVSRFELTSAFRLDPDIHDKMGLPKEPIVIHVSEETSKLWNDTMRKSRERHAKRAIEFSSTPEGMKFIQDSFDILTKALKNGELKRL